MAKFCSYCGNPVEESSSFCQNCGAKLMQEENSSNSNNPNAKSRVVAGLLGIFFGGIGVHNFYLGFNNKAIIQILVSFLTCGFGSIWGFIEGIMILCGSINEDSNGVALKD